MNLNWSHWDTYYDNVFSNAIFKLHGEKVAITGTEEEALLAAHCQSVTFDTIKV